MKPHRRRETEDISGGRDNLAKFPAENPFPVLRIGADGIVVDANAASLPLLDDWNTKIGQSAPDFWQQTARETLNTNEIKKDIEFEHKDRTISFTAVPVPEGDYVNLYGLDVTERKRTDQALRRSEEQLRLLVSGVKDYAIFMLSPIGLVVNWNEGAERIIGYRSEEIIGRHFSLFYSREERERDKPQYELDLAAEQDWYEEEGWRMCKDGSRFWADVVITTLYDSDGKLKGFSNVTRDITERKQAEEELDNLAKLPYENPSPVLRIDADGTVTYANAAGLPLLGDWHTELGQRAPDFWRRLVADLLSTNEMRSGIEVKHRDKVLSITGVPIAEAGYVNFYGLDITERYRAEEERGKAQALSDALNDINAVMSSTIVFNEIMQGTTRAAVNALDCESGAVILHEDGSWVPKHVFGGMTESILEERMTGRKTRHLDLAAKTNRLVVVDDAFNDPRVDSDWMKELGIKSFIVSPLAVREEIIGVLVFHYRSAKIPFSPAKVDFVEKLATSLSMVIQNARSHEATKQSLSDTEALRRMSARFTQTLELDDILDIGFREISVALGVEHGCIYILDASGNLSIRKQEKLTPEFLEAKVTISRNEGCAGQAVATGEVFAPTASEHDFTCEDSKRFLGLDCMLAMPLKAKGNILGVLELFAPVHRRLSDRERRTVTTMVNQLAAAIENANLYSRERNIADTLQETLLTVPDEIEGIDFGHLYRSATVETSDVGGDFYDLFELAHDKVGIVIGDVSGKGLKAATLTALVKNTIKAYAYQHDSPAKVVALTNDVVMRASELSEFVTLLFCILDKRTGALTYCDAGHPPPIVKRAESGAYLLKVGSPIIGVFKDVEYVDVEDRLQNGDILFVYTDGAIEARRNRELFGEERLVDLIDRLYSTEIRKLPQRVLEKIMDFAKNTMADDTALLAVTRKSGPGGHETDVDEQASEPTKPSRG